MGRKNKIFIHQNYINHNVQCNNKWEKLLKEWRMYFLVLKKKKLIIWKKRNKCKVCKLDKHQEIYKKALIKSD